MNKKNLLLPASLAILSWALLAPSRAICQGNTWAGESLQKLVEAARWRLGLLRVNASLQVSNAGYDSDIYYGYYSNPVHDFTSLASTPVQLLVPVNKRIVFDIYDNPQYLFYLEAKNQRGLNNIFRGRVHFAFDKFYIQAGGGLSNIRQRLSPELNINIRQKEDSLNGAILWQASRVASLALLYGSSQFDYGNAEFGGTSLAETLNRKEEYIDFVTYLQPSSRVRFSLDGQYSSYRFTEEVSNVKDSRSYGFFGGLEFIPKAGEMRRVEGIRGSISLGYKRFDIIDPLLLDGSGLVGAVNVSTGLLEKTTGRAFFSQDFAFSASVGASFYVSTAYGGGITRLISRRTSFSYDISFGRSTYPDAETGGEGIPAGIYNRYTTHSFSLDVRLARHLAITFLSTLGKRIVDASGLERNRNFFGFSMIYGFAPGSISAPIRGLSR